MTLGLAFAQEGQGRGYQRPGAVLPTVETAPVALLDPEPYQVAALLEPIRSLTLRAGADATVREISAEPGDLIKQGKLIARTDPAEAQLRFRLAEAQLSEQKLAHKLAGTDPAGSASLGAAKARVDAAEAQLEIARMALAANNLNAPFDGQVLSIAVGPGQLVLKGETIAVLIDKSRLSALIPVDRSTAKVGDAISLDIEGQKVEGKIAALVPLTDNFSSLRQLGTTFICARVTVPNAADDLQVGFRVLSPFLPNEPLTATNQKSVKRYSNGTASVQVLRDDKVTTVPVRIFGKLNAERVQVSGPFAPGDALILLSSVPLTDGTIVRFDASASAPGAGTFNPNVAPIGSGGAGTGGGGGAPSSKSAPKSAPAAKGDPF